MRVYHDAVETNCRHGHHCGMGIVSGDAAKCECAPAPGTHPNGGLLRRNVTSVANNGKFGQSEEKRQVLELRAETKTCLSKGDISTFFVNYHSADARPTDGVGFHLVFDPRFFRVRSVQLAANAGCGMVGGGQDDVKAVTYAQHTFVPFVCTAMDGSEIIPSREDGLMKVEFEVKGGYEGITKIGVEPKLHVHGTGYTYIAAQPIQLRVGHCQA